MYIFYSYYYLPIPTSARPFSFVPGYGCHPRYSVLIPRCRSCQRRRGAWVGASLCCCVVFLCLTWHPHHMQGDEGGSAFKLFLSLGYPQSALENECLLLLRYIKAVVYLYTNLCVRTSVSVRASTCAARGVCLCACMCMHIHTHACACARIHPV
jgi:hypothetical protein